MQDHHNLLYREEEREMFPTLKVCYTRLSIITIGQCCAMFYRCSVSGPSLGRLSHGVS